MEGAGQLLLAGAGLALDEDGELGGGEALQGGEELAHLGRGAEEAAEAGGLAALLGLGAVVDLEADGAVADAQEGARAQLGLEDAVRAEEGAVGGAQIAHEEAPLVAALQLQVGGRDARDRRAPDRWWSGGRRWRGPG